MTDEPLMKPVGDEPPETPPDRPTTGAVIGGTVVGVIGGIVLAFIATALLSNVSGDAPTIAMFGVPVLVGIVLLAVPSLRRTGAGFVMGLGIGSIVSAGVCGAFVAWVSTSLG